MSKKERIKAKLDLLKVLIVAILTAFFGIISFTAIHYKTLDYVLSICVTAGIVILLLILVYLGIDFNRELNKLEKEE